MPDIFLEESGRLLRLLGAQEQQEARKAEEERRQRAIAQEQRFAAAEATVHYHPDGSPVCEPVKLDIEDADGHPLYERYFRVYPCQTAPDDTPAMKATRLTLKHITERLQIRPRLYRLLFVGERIPRGFVPRAAATGGVITDRVTQMHLGKAPEPRMRDGDLLVPLSLPVGEMCQAILRLVIYETLRQRETMPPPPPQGIKQTWLVMHDENGARVAVPFSSFAASQEAAWHREDWLNGLMNRATSKARAIWKELGAAILKEAGC